MYRLFVKDLGLLQDAANFDVPARVHDDGHVQLLVSIVPVLGREVVESPRSLLGVAFQQLGLVPFEFGQALATVFQGVELAPGGLARLFQAV